MINILITPQRVLELAFANADYTPTAMVTAADIIAAERNYLTPVIGERLHAALAAGEYPELMDNFVAPALALYVREVANLPSAPRSPEGVKRARAMMLRLSEVLERDKESITEYESEHNVLNRCRINGGHIQIR